MPYCVRKLQMFMEYKFMTFGLENLFIFGKFSDFCCIAPETQRGGQGGTIPLAPNHCGGPKSQNNVTSTFFKTVHLLPKELRFEHRGAKPVFYPRRHLTSVRPCTARLSSQNNETCLQKHLPISGKLSITNYLKQNAVDYRSHLTIENNLKVEKNVYYFQNKHNSASP